MLNYIKNEGTHKVWTQTVNGVNVKCFIRKNVTSWDYGFKFELGQSIKQNSATEVTEADVLNFILNVTNL